MVECGEVCGVGRHLCKISPKNEVIRDHEMVDDEMVDCYYIYIFMFMVD